MMVKIMCSSTYEILTSMKLQKYLSSSRTDAAVKQNVTSSFHKHTSQKCMQIWQNSRDLRST